jgi:hypothetical protein
MNTELELLKQFFGGYFHEDWRLETQAPDEALTEYIAHSNPTERLALSKAIQEYLDRYPNEDDLAEKLLHELGCYYDPAPSGMPVKEWLQGITVHLLNTN